MESLDSRNEGFLREMGCYTQQKKELSAHPVFSREAMLRPPRELFASRDAHDNNQPPPLASEVALKEKFVEFLGRAVQA